MYKRLMQFNGKLSVNKELRGLIPNKIHKIKKRFIKILKWDPCISKYYIILKIPFLI